MDIVSLVQQVQARLQHTDVAFDAAQNDGLAVLVTFQVLLHVLGEHGEYLLVVDTHVGTVKVLRDLRQRVAQSRRVLRRDHYRDLQRLDCTELFIQQDRSVNAEERASALHTYEGVGALDDAGHLVDVVAKGRLHVTEEEQAGAGREAADAARESTHDDVVLSSCRRDAKCAHQSSTRGGEEAKYRYSCGLVPVFCFQNKVPSTKQSATCAILQTSWFPITDYQYEPEVGKDTISIYLDACDPLDR